MTNYPMDNALEMMENTIEIDLVNKATATTYPKALVYSTNTLSEVVEQFASDLGIFADGNLQFINKRTGRSTSDRNETVEEQGLQNGDVLAICDDAPVA